MNVFNKVTLQSLKKNKTRTLVTIIGIILSAAMICAVTTFTSSFLNYGLETSIYSDGNWHGRQINTSFETYKSIESSDDVEAAVYLQELGYALADGCENEFKPYIYLLGAGKDVDSTLQIHIISGEYPSSAAEILLPEHLYTNGGVKYSIGDTVTLELGQRMFDGLPMTQSNPCYIYENGKEVFNGETLEIRETRTYTVSGFYERMSVDIEQISAPGYTAITLADSESSADYSYDVYFRMQNPKKVYSFMKEMNLSGDQNTDVLMYLGTSSYSTFKTMLYSLAAIVIGLIMFGSVSLIYNAFSISVSERTKQFGLLASVGATKKQLRRMVLFEAFAVSIVGIPLGVLAGIGGIGVTLMLIGDKFRAMGFPIDMKLSVSAVSVIIASLVALITVLISAWIPSKRATKVSAVEAIRQNQDVNADGKDVKTSKLTYKLFGLPGVLANKYYKRSRKKYRATVLSLFMSIVLFVSASAFTDYLVESVNGGFSSVGYDLYFSCNRDYFDRITPNEMLDKVISAASVTNAACTQNENLYTEIDRKFLTDDVKESFDELPDREEGEEPTNESINTYVVFVDDTSFRTLLKDNGLSEQKFMDAENPLAVAVDGITYFNGMAERFETVKYLKSDNCEFTVKRLGEIEGYLCYGEIEDENGNRIVRYVKNDGSDYEDGEYLDVPMDSACHEETLRTGKVIYDWPYYLNTKDGVNLLYPMSLAGSVLADYERDDNRYYFTVISDDHVESYAAIETLLADNGFNAKNLMDIVEYEEANRNTVLIIQVFSYGFIVLISLIAAANVFNTISTNISLRRREFAMLKSVGMTAKGFNRMMNYECLLYGSKALLLGLPVSCGITYLIYLSIIAGYETSFHLPWRAIGIATLSVFFVVFATMMYSMSKIKKDNPIDALKNENL